MIELPEGCDTLLDRENLTWDRTKSGLDRWICEGWFPRTLDELLHDRGPLRPVGPPLPAPEPPMVEPTRFGAMVMTQHGRAVLGDVIKHIWYGTIEGGCYWNELINPRPVDEPALTLDAVLAVVEGLQTEFTVSGVRHVSMAALNRALRAKFGGTR